MTMPSETSAQIWDYLIGWIAGEGKDDDEDAD